VHLMKVEQNRNYVNDNSDLSEICRSCIFYLSLGKG
jgi:hypothetical protein